MDVDDLQVTVGVEQQLGDVCTARERRPVEADVLLLERQNTLSRSASSTREPRVKEALASDLVPDADVGSFGQQQLHLVHVLVLCGPDHGRPASVVLGRGEQSVKVRDDTGRRVKRVRLRGG